MKGSPRILSTAGEDTAGDPIVMTSRQGGLASSAPAKVCSAIAWGSTMRVTVLRSTSRSAVVDVGRRRFTRGASSATESANVEGGIHRIPVAVR
jgi:hypothetical protein